MIFVTNGVPYARGGDEVNPWFNKCPNNIHMTRKMMMSINIRERVLTCPDSHVRPPERGSGNFSRFSWS